MQAATPTDTVSQRTPPMHRRSLVSSPAPRYWATTTVPPAAIPLNIQVMRLMMGPTRDTAATELSPFSLIRAVISTPINVIDMESSILGKVRFRI